MKIDESALTNHKVRRIKATWFEKFKLKNDIEKIEWHFDQICDQPRGGHTEYFKRLLVKNCDQIKFFSTNESLQCRIVYQMILKRQHYQQHVQKQAKCLLWW